MTAVLICLAAWAVASMALLALLRRDYAGGEVWTDTAVLIWAWHLLNYALLVLLALEGALALELPAALRVSGLGLIAIGLGLVAAGFYEFRSIARLTGTRRDEVVDSGIYRYSRHPQYLGIILTLIGAALAGDSGAALLLSLALTAAFGLHLPMEERYVLRALGDEYERYQRRAPMLLGLPK